MKHHVTLLLTHVLLICVQSDTQNCLMSYSCTGSIFCFYTEPCIIKCDGETDTSYGACRTAQVEIQSATDLTLNCHKSSDCRDMNVQCGTGDCTINCGIDIGYSDFCNGMNITCGPGSCDINCNQIGVNACVGVTMDVALASSYSCTGPGMECDAVTYIDDTTPADNPTESPIASTTIPTTFIPTTFIPTYIPTSSVPTTSIPSTSIPTTFIPTTTIPTTYFPTTSIPSTYNPTTATKIPTTNPTLSTTESTAVITSNALSSLETIAILSINIARINGNFTVTDIVETITDSINDEFIKLSVPNTDYVLDIDVIDNTIIVTLMATEVTVLDTQEINNIKEVTKTNLIAEYGPGIVITDTGIVNEYISTVNTKDEQLTDNEQSSGLSMEQIMIAGIGVVLCIGLLILLVLFIWKVHKKRKTKSNDKLTNAGTSSGSTNIEMNRISSMSNTNVTSMSKCSLDGEEIDTTIKTQPGYIDYEEMYTSTPIITPGRVMTPRGKGTPGNSNTPGNNNAGFFVESIDYEEMYTSTPIITHGAVMTPCGKDTPGNSNTSGNRNTPGNSNTPVKCK